MIIILAKEREINKNAKVCMAGGTKNRNRVETLQSRSRKNNNRLSRAAFDASGDSNLALNLQDRRRTEGIRFLLGKKWRKGKKVGRIPS